jgi:hypothetical protein
MRGLRFDGSRPHPILRRQSNVQREKRMTTAANLRRALGAAGAALAVLPILLVGSASAATTEYAGGLTTPAGAILAPDGRWWVSDHDAGFCRVTGPVAGAQGPTPGTIEPGTCLGGALADPPPRPGPEAAETPAFHDPTPGAPNSGDELVYVPDGATGSDRLDRLRWDPATGQFSLQDTIVLMPGPGGDTDLRPTVASLGPDGDLYVAAGGRPAAIQRVADPEGPAPTAQVVGHVDRILAMAAGADAAGKVAVYVGEPEGITKLYPSASGTAASQPTAFALGNADPATPFEAGGMAYDVAAGALYVGTASAAHAGPVDKLVRFPVAAAGAGETLAEGRDSITGVSLGQGSVAIFDGPVGTGDAVMSLVGDPRATPFAGPPPAPVVVPGAPAGAPGAGAPGAAAPAPGTVPGAAPAGTAPSPTTARRRSVARVTRLGVPRRIAVRRLRAGGLRIAMRVPRGTRAVLVRITPRRAGASRRPLVSVRRAVRRPGLVTITLRGRAVRRLRAGRYTVAVSALSRAGAGPVARRSLRITR